MGVRARAVGSGGSHLPAPASPPHPLEVGCGGGAERVADSSGVRVTCVSGAGRGAGGGNRMELAEPLAVVVGQVIRPTAHGFAPGGDPNVEA